MVVLLMLAVLGQAGSPPRDRPATATSPGTAAISGRITDRASGAPVRRAIVSLAARDGSKPLQTVADEDGRYQFTLLAAGEYGVVAGPPELQANYLRQAFGRQAPLDRFEALSGGIVLSAGERRENVDIVLTRALAIEGRVIAPSGEGMGGIRILLTQASGAPHQTYDAQSDDRGDYRLYGLAPGRYRVCVNPSDSRDPLTAEGTRLLRTCHPRAVTDADAADVVLAEASASGIDIQVQRGGTYTVTVAVLDHSGAAVERGRVSAVPSDRQQSGGSGIVEKGRGVIRGLVPGRYVLLASDGEPDTSLDTSTSTVSRPRETGFLDLDVASDVSDAVVHLSLPRTIAGRVTFEGTSAPAGRSLRMAVHAVTLLGPRGYNARQPVGPVNEDSTFSLPNIYPHPVALEVSGLPEGWAIKAMRYAGRDIRGMMADLYDSAQTSQLEIVATDRVATPSVRLLADSDPPGQPWVVVVQPADPARWRAGFSVNRPGGTNADTLKLPPLIPGDYFVAVLGHADAALLFQDPTRLQRLSGVATRIELAEGDRRTLELPFTRLPEAGR